MGTRIEPMPPAIRVHGEWRAPRGGGPPMSGSAISRKISRFDTEKLGRTAVGNRLRSALEHTRKHRSQTLLTTLGRQQWLDRPSYRLEHALTLVFAAFGRRREAVSNALHGTWLGHPLHPALTAVPTGAVATAMALDAASVLPGRSSAMRDASRLARRGNHRESGSRSDGHDRLAAHTHDESRRIGIAHGLLNTVATAPYAVSWWDRKRGRHLRGMAGTALGYGLTIGSGYLGAALVYGSGVGVDRSRVPDRSWTNGLPCCPRPRWTDNHRGWRSAVSVWSCIATRQRPGRRRLLSAEEERDLCPPPVEMSDNELDALGDRMWLRMAELRGSTIEKLHIKGRTALLRTF
jgi:uncharacterized membrane protein